MEELTPTANAQLATFVQSLVVLDAVERLGLSPAACAGHSLGEYTALVASGALSFADGIHLVVARGDAMARAGEDAPGTMAALLGISDDDAEAACQRAEGDAWVAELQRPRPGRHRRDVRRGGDGLGDRPRDGRPQGHGHPGLRARSIRR